MLNSTAIYCRVAIESMSYALFLEWSGFRDRSPERIP